MISCLFYFPFTEITKRVSFMSSMNLCFCLSHLSFKSTGVTSVWWKIRFNFHCFHVDNHLTRLHLSKVHSLPVDLQSQLCSDSCFHMQVPRLDFPPPPPFCDFFLCKYHLVFLKINFFYLVALGLSCSTWDLRSSLKHVNPYLQHVGSSSLTRDATWAACFGSLESLPLDHQGNLPLILICYTFIISPDIQ